MTRVRISLPTGYGHFVDYAFVGFGDKFVFQVMSPGITYLLAVQTQELLNLILLSSVSRICAQWLVSGFVLPRSIPAIITRHKNYS